MGNAVIPFLDLTRQTRRLRFPLEKAIHRVMEKGAFILGSEVAHLEQEFARFCKSRFGIGVASGTDALELALQAAGVGPGDLVATVSFTFIATADAVRHVGAEPLFVDIDPATFTMDPADLEARLKSLSQARRRRLKAILPVHLFGHPCNMDAIARIARRYRLRVIEDAAQAAGAAWKGKPAGSLGDAGCFSFFPTKNLGAFGDGGMVVTQSKDFADTLRLLRVHGRKDRERQVLFGRNSRLDELQAAILRIKLRKLSGWVQQRRALARRYNRLLADLPGLQCPKTAAGATHAYHLYVIRTKDRDRLHRKLQGQGIPTQIYYSVPIHHQPLYRKKHRTIRLLHTEKAAREVLALPLFPELRIDELTRICRVLVHSLNITW